VTWQDRSFGASSARSKKKTGGLSNKEKAHKKDLPLAVRLMKANSRDIKSKKMRNVKNFKGRKAWK
jgi:protein SDA1